MARKALMQAIESLQLKRGAMRSEAKAYQNRRTRASGEVCVRTHNLLLQCAQLTCAIIALKNILGGVA